MIGKRGVELCSDCGDISLHSRLRECETLSTQISVRETTVSIVVSRY